MEKEGLEYASFRLSGALFGVDVAKVREVVKGALKPNPPGKAPACSFSSGAIELRSLSIPVIDLHNLFSLPATGAVSASSECIIIVSAGGRIVGLAVDEVLDVDKAGPEAVIRPVTDRTFSPYLYGEVDSLIGPVFIISLDTVGALLKNRGK